MSGIFDGQFGASGPSVIPGNLTVGGDLDVSGTINTGGSGEGQIVDAINTLNYGEAGAGVGGAGLSGIEIDRGSETNARLIWDESLDKFQAGLTGALIDITLGAVGTANYVPYGAAGGTSLTESANMTFDGSTLAITGNITVTGNVDGKDVAGHVDDATLHFTEASIAHQSISGAGTNTHAQIDTAVTNSTNHIADATLHFTEGSINHQSITGAGTNTHAQIDTAVTASTNHIADATLHFTEGSIDHGSIAGLADDDHTIYALADGTRDFSGNVTITGGGMDITGNVGIGTTAALAYGNVHIKSASSTAVSVSANADEVVVEGTGNIGASFITSNTGLISLDFGDNNSTTSGRVSYNNATDDMKFRTGGVDAVTIDNAQQVGIGTASPSEALDVVGNIAVSGTVDGVDIQTLNTAAGVSTTHTTSTGADHSYIDQAVTTTGTPQFANIGVGKVATSIPLDVTSAGADFAQKIYNTNVTTAYGLRIDTTTATSGQALFVATGGEAKAFVILNDGKIGVGEDGPLGQLHVKSADAGAFTPSTSADEAIFENSSDSGISIIGGASSFAGIRMGDASLPSTVTMQVNNTDQKFSINNATGIIAFNVNSVDAMALTDTDITIGVPITQTNASSTTTDPGIISRCTNASFAGSVIQTATDRTSSTAFGFLTGVSDSDGTPDTEFNLRGDGEGLCDGSWTGGGADYAEVFESADGSKLAYGISVTINSDGKVAETAEGEVPDGVISAAPGIRGNVGLNWKKKYLKGDYGETLLDSDGKKQLNPDYDAEQEFITRDLRDEWNDVGLLGQLPVTKGQIIAPNWKLIKNISETVDLYLVK